MRVINDTSQEELVRSRAFSAVKWKLLELAANLMRVSAGAGRSHELAFQAQEFVNACVAYQEAAGHLPDPFDIDEALRTDKPVEWKLKIGDDAAERLYAEETIIRGALRNVASELLGQRVQAIAGAHLMREGVNQLVEAREKARRAWQAQSKPTRSRRKKAVRKQRPRPKPEG